MSQRQVRKLKRCLGCGEKAVIVNSVKTLCQRCAPKAKTKSWVLGIGKEAAVKLRNHVYEGDSVTQMATLYGVTEQTIVAWFKHYFGGKTYRDIRREMLNVDVLEEVV